MSARRRRTSIILLLVIVTITVLSTCPGRCLAAVARPVMPPQHCHGAAPSDLPHPPPSCCAALVAVAPDSAPADAPVTLVAAAVSFPSVPGRTEPLTRTGARPPDGHPPPRSSYLLFHALLI